MSSSVLARVSIAAAVVLSAAQPAHAAVARPERATVGVAKQVTAALDIPWGLAFFPDGSALVAERETFRIVRISRAWIKSTVGTVPGVTAAGEGGLLGLAISPTFSTDQRIYVYYSTETDNRIAYMTYIDGVLGSPQPILIGIPRNNAHNGGRLAFGPDGMLYASTGDAQQPDRAQSMDSRGGKILRMTKNGHPAPGNPFPNRVIYSLGHRNVQGLAFDSSGRLWASELGAADVDELNLIQPGGNYGWPTCEGACAQPGFIDPVQEWPVADASPSGLAIADDVIFMAALRGKRLWRMEITGSTVTAPVSYFDDAYGRLRTVQRTPTGHLWLTTSNGGDADRVLRVELS